MNQLTLGLTYLNSSFEDCKILVKEHPELLNGDIEIIIADFISKETDESSFIKKFSTNQSPAELITHYRIKLELLSFCREIGYKKTFDNAATYLESLTTRMQQLVLIDPFDDIKDYLLQNNDLLSSLALIILDNLYRAYDDKKISLIANRCLSVKELLLECKKSGIEDGINWLKKKKENDMVAAIYTMLAFETWQETKRFIIDNPDLLSPYAAYLLQGFALLFKNEGNHRWEKRAKEHLEVLNKCNEQGIEKTFEGLISAASSSDNELTTWLESASTLANKIIQAGKQDNYELVATLADQLLTLGNKIKLYYTAITSRLIIGGTYWSAYQKHADRAFLNQAIIHLDPSLEMISHFGKNEPFHEDERNLEVETLELLVSMYGEKLNYEDTPEICNKLILINELLLQKLNPEKDFLKIGYAQLNLGTFMFKRTEWSKQYHELEAFISIKSLFLEAIKIITPSIDLNTYIRLCQNLSGICSGLYEITDEPTNYQDAVWYAQKAFDNCADNRLPEKIMLKVNIARLIVNDISRSEQEKIDYLIKTLTTIRSLLPDELHPIRIRYSVEIAQLIINNSDLIDYNKIALTVLKECVSQINKEADLFKVYLAITLGLSRLIPKEAHAHELIQYGHLAYEIKTFANPYSHVELLLLLIQANTDLEEIAKVEEQEKYMEVNIELLKETYEIINTRALKVNDTQVWILDRLSAYYIERKIGDRAYNIEQARHYGLECLSKLDPKSSQFNDQKRRTLNTLCLVYLHRHNGSRHENLVTGLQYGMDCLTVAKEIGERSDIFKALINIGNIYRRLDGNDENIHTAISYYQEGLALLDNDDDFNRAATYQNIASAFKGFAEKSAATLAEAIRYHELALTIYTKEKNPRRYAICQVDCVETKFLLQSFAKEREYAELIAIIEDNLMIEVVQQDKYLFLEQCGTLVQLYFVNKDWEKLLVIAQKAILSGEEILSVSQNKSQIISKIKAIYEFCELNLINMNRLTEALWTHEMARSKILNELTIMRGFVTSGITTRDQELMPLCNDIENLTTLLHRPLGSSQRKTDREIMEELVSKRFRFNQLVGQTNIINDYFSTLNLPDFTTYIRQDEVVIIPTINALDASVYFLTSETDELTGNNFFILDTSTDEGMFLFGLTHGANEWKDLLSNIYSRPNDLLNYIDAIGNRIWTAFFEKVIRRIEQQFAGQKKKLIIIPHGTMGLFPLQLCYTTENDHRTYALDDYTVQYMPSLLQFKEIAKKKFTTYSDKRMLAIVDPQCNLPFSCIEGSLIRRSLPDNNHSMFFNGGQAEKDNVINAFRENGHFDYIHFSCHGHFDPVNIYRSGLCLAQYEVLSLNDILGYIVKQGARLVTLSACVTGLFDSELSNEFLGLFSGFLQAGVGGVISSLWQVDDLATMLLMERIYHYILIHDNAPAIALKKAQRWLRDATYNSLDHHITELVDQEAMKQHEADEIRQYLERYSSVLKPFAHPFYWAGFCYYGL